MAISSEELFQSMETIAQGVVSKTKYDITKECTIVDNSNKNLGEYIVSDGSINFKVYSPDSYRVGEIVYVLIPQGDYNQQKIITGRKILDSTMAYNYLFPFDTMVELQTLETDQTIYGISAGAVNEETLALDSIEFFNKKDLNFSNYTRLGFKADFFASIKNLLFIDKYGIKITLIDKEDKNHIFKFDSTEMLGNLYDTKGFFPQEVVFQINNIKTITEIKAELFQGEKFIENYNNDKNQNPERLLIKNIQIKNPKIVLGFDLDNDLEIICSDNSNGIYNNYSTSGDILDIAESRVLKTLSLNLQDELKTKIQSIEWIFPNNSMLQKANNDIKDSGYYILDKYYNSLNNNTVTCNIKIKEKTYNISKTFTFGFQGVKTSTYSLKIQYLDGPCFEIPKDDSNPGETTSFTVCLILTDGSNKILSFSDFNNYTISYNFREAKDYMLDDMPLINENNQITFSLKNKFFNEKELEKLYLIFSIAVTFQDDNDENIQLELDIPVGFSSNKTDFNYITGPQQVSYNSSGSADYLKTKYQIFNNKAEANTDLLIWDINNIIVFEPQKYYIYNEEDKKYELADDPYDSLKDYYIQEEEKEKVLFFESNPDKFFIYNNSTQTYNLIINEEDSTVTYGQDYYEKNDYYQLKENFYDDIKKNSENIDDKKKDFFANAGKYWRKIKNSNTIYYNVQYECIIDDINKIPESNITEVINDELETGYYVYNLEENTFESANDFDRSDKCKFWFIYDSDTKKYRSEQFIYDDSTKEMKNPLDSKEDNKGWILLETYTKTNQLVNFIEDFYVDENGLLLHERPENGIGYQYKYIKIQMADNSELSSDFRIENQSLVPLNTYFVGLEYQKNIIQCYKIKEGAKDYVWRSPLLIYKSQKTKSDYNKNSGVDQTIIDAKINPNTQNIIMGYNREPEKQSNTNTLTFTGITIGEYQDEKFENHGGIYGFNHGSPVFGLKDNGTAFFGKQGHGRILIDGNSSTIESQLYVDTQKDGLQIDFDDGKIIASKEIINDNQAIIKKILINSKAENTDYPFAIGVEQPDGTIKGLTVDWNGNVFINNKKVQTVT